MLELSHLDWSPLGGGGDGPLLGPEVVLGDGDWCAGPLRVGLSHHQAVALLHQSGHSSALAQPRSSLRPPTLPLEVVELEGESGSVRGDQENLLRPAPGFVETWLSRHLLQDLLEVVVLRRGEEALYLGTREERPADVTEHVLELGDALQSEEGQHLSRELSH